MWLVVLLAGVADSVAFSSARWHLEYWLAGQIPESNQKIVLWRSNETHTLMIKKHHNHGFSSWKNGASLGWKRCSIYPSKWTGLIKYIWWKASEFILLCQDILRGWKDVLGLLDVDMQAVWLGTNFSHLIFQWGLHHRQIKIPAPSMPVTQPFPCILAVLYAVEVAMWPHQSYCIVQWVLAPTY